MDFINLKTDRLTLRPFKRTDAADLHSYLSVQDVIEYEPYAVQAYDECCHLALEREKKPQFIAICLQEKMIGNLFFEQSEDDSAIFELGFVFHRDFWGKGYAFESANALIYYAFNDMNARKITAYCNTENERSWKLLERLFMKRSRGICHDTYFKFDENGKPIWFDTFEYSLSKHRFKRKY